MVITRDKNGGQNLNIKTHNKIFESVKQFIYIREHTYIHIYIHTYIYTFHRSLKLSPDNRMWNMSKTHKSIKDTKIITV